MAASGLQITNSSRQIAQWANDADKVQREARASLMAEQDGGGDNDYEWETNSRLRRSARSKHICGYSDDDVKKPDVYAKMDEILAKHAKKAEEDSYQMFELKKGGCCSKQSEDDSAWKDFTTKPEGKQLPRWLLRNIMRRHYLLKMKRSDEENLKREEDGRLPMKMTGTTRRELDNLSKSLAKTLAAAKEKQGMFNVQCLWPPKRPVRGEGEADGLKFGKTAGAMSDMQLNPGLNDPSKPAAKPKTAAQEGEVVAMYDDLGSAKYVKTAGNFWPVGMDDTPSWEGNQAGEFSRPVYPLDMFKDGMSSVANENDANPKKAHDEWLGPAHKPKDWEELTLEAAALGHQTLEDYQEGDFARDQVEREMSMTRNSSYNAGARSRVGIRPDSFEIAAKDWEIELNIMTDRHKYKRPAKIVWQRQRRPQSDLREDMISYGGGDMLTGGSWTRLEVQTEERDGALYRCWREPKEAAGANKLRALQDKVARKRSENNVLKYRNEMLMQMLTCAQLELEKYTIELDFAKEHF